MTRANGAASAASRNARTQLQQLPQYAGWESHDPTRYLENATAFCEPVGATRLQVEVIASCCGESVTGFLRVLRIDCGTLPLGAMHCAPSLNSKVPGKLMKSKRQATEGAARWRVERFQVSWQMSGQ